MGAISNLSKYLDDRREAIGISRRDLAAELKLSRSSYWRRVRDNSFTAGEITTMFVKLRLVVIILKDGEYDMLSDSKTTK